MPGNVEAVSVWNYVNSQHIMGPMGPVGLNLLAVFKVMEMLGVNDQQVVIAKVMNIYNETMSVLRQQEKVKR